MNVGKQKIALGCYTDDAHPNGLRMLELDESSGVMSVLAERPVSNALYQALSPDGKYLKSLGTVPAEGPFFRGADATQPNYRNVQSEMVWNRLITNICAVFSWAVHTSGRDKD